MLQSQKKNSRVSAFLKWNGIVGTSERGGETHVDFPERVDTTLNRTELNRTELSRIELN